MGTLGSYDLNRRSLLRAAGLLAAPALTQLVPVAVAATRTTPARTAPARAAPAGPATTSPVETTLWDSAAGAPYLSFHVHGLAVVPGQGSGGGDVVLAFTEGRYEVSDGGPKEPLLRRSADGGQTWSASTVVVPAGTVGSSLGNPTPVVDGTTGAVLLFFNSPGGRIHLTRSDDAGLTWQPPVELTHLFTDNPHGWVLNSPGPGHGIQLDSGRLLVPVTHRRSVELPATERRYGISALFSDDGGVSWQRGGPVPVSPAYPINECRFVQRADGAVVTNGRWAAGGTRYRITATSTDGGATWADPVIDGATGEFVAVDAGWARFSGGPGSPEPSRLVYSRPAASARENLTVSVSYDDGASYRYGRVVNTGPSYYSDLAVLSDGTVVLLYGRDGTHAAFPERVAVARLGLDWLTDGRDGGPGGPGLGIHSLEIGTAQAVSSAPRSTQIVADRNALGGALLRLDGQPGDHVELPFTAPGTGTHEAAVRLWRGPGCGRLRVSLDGVDLPLGEVDPTLTTGTGYQVYALGDVALSAGPHLLRFTVTGEGYTGGAVAGLDQFLLTARAAAAVADPAGVIADNDSAASFQRIAGTWSRATGVAGYYGQSYHSHPAGPGTALARWRPDVPATGRYDVAVRYTEHANRSAAAPFTVRHADGDQTVLVDQRTGGGTWLALGSFRFVAGRSGCVELSDAADGFVIADAVRLTPAP